MHVFGDDDDRVCGCGLGGGKTSEYLAWVAMEVSEMGDHGPGVGSDL